MVINQRRYSAAQLQRNRKAVGIFTLAGVVAVVVLLIAGSVSQAANAAALLLVLVAFAWWLFASSEAGPVEPKTTSYEEWWPR